jgi:hypothetical protein
MLTDIMKQPYSNKLLKYINSSFKNYYKNPNYINFYALKIFLIFNLVRQYIIPRSISNDKTTVTKPSTENKSINKIAVVINEASIKANITINIEEIIRPDVQTHFFIVYVA